MATPPMNQLGNIPFAAGALQNVAQTPQGQTPGATPAGGGGGLMGILGGLMGRPAPVSPGMAPQSQGSGNIIQQLMGHLLGQSVATGNSDGYEQMKAITDQYMKQNYPKGVSPAQAAAPQSVLAAPQRKKASK